MLVRARPLSYVRFFCESISFDSGSVRRAAVSSREEWKLPGVVAGKVGVVFGRGVERVRAGALSFVN